MLSTPILHKFLCYSTGFHEEILKDRGITRKSQPFVIEPPRGGVRRQDHLSDSRWSENTINTYKYNTIFWSSNSNYYNLGSCISYIEEVWSQNYASGYRSEFAEVISLNGHDVIFALKEDAIHRRSKPKDPSTESNPHRFELPTDNPHRHRWQEEAVPHLHRKNNKSKAWATTLNKTYPRWPKDHL
jgi:hypothetical protein